MEPDLSRNDLELLKCYALASDEAAFEQLVSRYLSLVFGVGMRGSGDRDLAQEIAQNCFTILARKSKVLSRSRRSVSLAGWLIKTARLETKKAMRTRIRRIRKIAAFADEARITAGPEPSIESKLDSYGSLLPHLDEALSKLSPRDREVISQRYYEELKYRQIARATGRSEDAVRKHLSRAVARLSGLLNHYHANTSTSAVVLVLTAALAKSAPAAVSASSVAAGALASAPKVGVLSLIANTAQTMAYPKQITCAATILLAGGITAIQWTERLSLSREIESLKSPPHPLAASRSRGTFSTGERNDSPAKPVLLIAPPIDSLSGETDWPRLIKLFEQARFGGDSVRQLFVAQLHSVYTSQGFAPKELASALDKLVRLHAPQQMVDDVAYELTLLSGQDYPSAVADTIIRDPRIPLAALNQTLYHFGKLDPQGALNWHATHAADGSLDPIGGRDANLIASSFAGLLAGIAETDVELAANQLQSLSADPARLALERIADRAENTDEVDGILAQLIPAATGANTIKHHAIEIFARSIIGRGEYDAAWNFINRHDPEKNGHHSDALIAALLRDEVNTNVQQAPRIADWISANREKLPESPGSLRHVLGRVLTLWEVNLDSESASAWRSDHQPLLEEAGLTD